MSSAEDDEYCDQSESECESESEYLPPAKATKKRGTPAPTSRQAKKSRAVEEAKDAENADPAPPAAKKSKLLPEKTVLAKLKAASALECVPILTAPAASGAFVILLRRHPLTRCRVLPCLTLRHVLPGHRARRLKRFLLELYSIAAAEKHLGDEFLRDSVPPHAQGTEAHQGDADGGHEGGVPGDHGRPLLAALHRPWRPVQRRLCRFYSLRVASQGGLE